MFNEMMGLFFQVDPELQTMWIIGIILGGSLMWLIMYALSDRKLRAEEKKIEAVYDEYSQFEKDLAAMERIYES